jgi:hypothetical protein
MQEEKTSATSVALFRYAHVAVIIDAMGRKGTSSNTSTQFIIIIYAHAIWLSFFLFSPIK